MSPKSSKATTAPKASPAKPTKFRFKPVTAANWADFEALFKAKGGPKHCWCMAYRMSKEELKHNTSASRKKFMHERVESKVPVGLLAYDGETPVAWCSVAPRDSFNTIGGEEDLIKVWSISCFYIQSAYRRQGLTAQLIDKAKSYARKHKAHYLEAYAVDKDSPSYRHMGFVETFEKAGFKYVQEQGARRKVMVCKL